MFWAPCTPKFQSNFKALKSHGPHFTDAPHFVMVTSVCFHVSRWKHARALLPDGFWMQNLSHQADLIGGECVVEWTWRSTAVYPQTLSDLYQ